MRTISALLASLSLAACGGGSSPSPTPAPPAPPAPAPPAPAPPPPPPPPPPTPTHTIGGTVSGLGGTVVLQNNAADDLSLSADGAFTFATPIAAGSNYDVTIKTQPASPEQLCSVSHATGTVAGADIVDVAVTCVDVPVARVWSTPVLVEFNNISSVQRPKIAIDAAGDALAVWEQSNGTANQIHANRYASGWDAPTIIGPGAGTPPLGAFIASVAFDGAGDALALWHQNDAPGAPTASFNVWWTRSTAGSAFTAPAQLSNGDSAGPAQLAVNAAGDAVAVWSQLEDASGGSVAHVYASTFSPAGGWSAPQRIAGKLDTGSTKAQVALDDQGNALVVWMQSDVPGSAGRANIWGARYVAGGGWEAAQLIENDDAGNAAEPQIAMQPGGNAFAVWQASDGTRTNIWANHFVKGTGWATAEKIETSDIGPAYAAHIAVDSAGNAIAVWAQYLGPSVQSIVANRYSNGAWGTAVAIESDDTGDADVPQIAMNATGTAQVVWTHALNGSRTEVMTNRYVPGSGWETPTMISTESAPAGQNAFSPQIALNASGVAQSVWIRMDGVRGNLWSSRLE